MNWSLGVCGAAAGRRAPTIRAGMLLPAIAASWWLLAGVANAAPTPSKAPAITGTAQVGQTLTLTRGTWTDTVATDTPVVTDQWESCNGTCTPVGTANSSSYVVALSDAGGSIEVAESATDAVVTTPVPGLPSNVIGPVTVPLPAGGVPTISGMPQQGQPLTVTHGNWSNSPTSFTDQWAVCTGAVCTAIAGQIGTTYTPTAADVGHTIDVVETAANAGGTSLPATSSQTAVVTGNKTAPSIAGVAQEGQILRLTQGVWTNSPTSVTDQWQSCAGAVCAPVGTSSTYLVAPTDVGHTIQVVETATKPPALPLTATAATGTVSPLSPPIDILPPGISGTPQQGQTLTLAHGTWMNSAALIADQWQQCDVFGANCVALPGQTGATYTLTPGDVGHAIGVVETASNDGGAGLPAASGRTTAVSATSATTVVAFSSNAPTTNQTVALVATISSSSGNANPSGTVSFFAGSSAISSCTGKVVKGGQTVTVICPAGFPAGNPQIFAVYQRGPGSLVDGSTSAATTIAIGRDSTSVSLATTKRVRVGKRAMYSAAIVLPVSNSGPIQPTGSIEFLDGGHPIPACASEPLTNLGATCTVSYQSAGTHQIFAVYSGDANFAGSTSSASSVQIAKGATKTPAVLGFVRSLLAWSFFYHPTYTQVMQFKVSAVVKRTTIVLTCRGGGCPFVKLQLAPTHRSSINLLPRFERHRLRPGAQLTLSFTHPNWVGKYYSFTIRAGAPPALGQKCLAVGRSVPGGGC
jgi:hypothetical protein